jgi:hypothetical protein
MAVAPLGLGLLAGACGDRDGGPIAGPDAASAFVHAPGVVYRQREFLGNPLVSEVTVPKRLHQLYNTTMPYNAARFVPVTQAFVTEVAGRPASVGAVLSSVLYPDVLVVQTDRDPSTAGWLTWALANGYGGRKLADDVVDIGLVAIFGPLLSPVNVSPGLATDNVPLNDTPFLPAFPYVWPAH